MRFSSLAVVPSVLSLVALGACASPSSSDDGVAGDNAFSSNQATLLDFEFDASLTTDSSWDDNQTIQDQLLYTIGHLNADKSVGRLDKLTLTNVQRTEDAGTITISVSTAFVISIRSG